MNEVSAYCVWHQQSGALDIFFKGDHWPKSLRTTVELLAPNLFTMIINNCDSKSALLGNEIYSHWCRRRGWKRYPKTFDLVKIRKNLFKSGKNLWKLGQNVWKPSQNRCMCFAFTEMAPKIKVQTFFFFFRGLFIVWLFSGKLEEVWASLGKIWAKWFLKCFDLKKCAQREMKCSRFFLFLFFWSSFFLAFFRASLGKFEQKFFAPPKICLALHLCQFASMAYLKCDGACHVYCV